MTKKLIVSILAVSVILLTTFSIINYIDSEDLDDEYGLDTFESEDEMRDFISYNDVSQTYTASDEYVLEGAEMESRDMDIEADETVVQVRGIDEPDIVKTDGERLYYQGQFREKLNTSIIDLEDLEIEKNLSESGNLLLHEDILIIFGDERVTGYDTENGDELWTESFDHRYETARLREDEIVLVLSEGIDFYSPCPIRPYGGVDIPCSGIIRPGFNYNSDISYSFVSIDPEDGSVNNKKSFIGDRSSEFYITNENIYFTYTGQEKRSDVFFEFLIEHSSIGNELRDRLREVKSYELSENAYNVEIDFIMERYLDENDERAQVIEEELEEFLVNRKREHHWTTVARLDETLEMDGEESVPGTVNDRMHMHEYDGKLFLLSGIEPGYGLRSNRTNDIYILSEDFSIDENIEGLSGDFRPEVRFSGEDLFITEEESTIQHFSLEELEFKNSFDDGSGFLFDVNNTLISISRDPDDFNLTTSTFDLETGDKIDREVFDVRWSRVTHDMKSFQIDPESGIMFLPTNEEALIIDFKDNIQAHELNISSAGRAFFLDDIIVIGRGEIKSFSQDDLSETNRLEIPLENLTRYREEGIEVEEDAEIPR